MISELIGSESVSAIYYQVYLVCDNVRIVVDNCHFPSIERARVIRAYNY